MSEKPEPGWFSRSEMARIFATTPHNFDATYRRWFSEVRQFAGRPYFRPGPVLKQKFDTRPGAKPESGDDPLLSGGDSPALEEYRRARARLAWMEVNEREKTHVPLEQLEPALMGLTGVLRRAGDRLARQYGNDAAAVLNEAVDQWAESVETLLVNDEPDAAAAEADRAEHPHAAIADDA